MLLSYQTAGFFDNRYLLKETINVLDFLNKDSYQKR